MKEFVQESDVDEGLYMCSLCLVSYREEGTENSETLKLPEIALETAQKTLWKHK